jgi:hypothetical protein
MIKRSVEDTWKAMRWLEKWLKGQTKKEMPKDYWRASPYFSTNILPRVGE